MFNINNLRKQFEINKITNQIPDETADVLDVRQETAEYKKGYLPM